MNYKRIYYNIVNNRKNNKPSGYCENHHIIPRCIGGDDDLNNLVFLTSREHFICHYLLAKMYEAQSVKWHKLNHAFMMMKPDGNKVRYYNSRLYESLRKNFSEVMSASQTGEKNSQYGTMWIYNIELQKNKKINIDDEIPQDWELGRKLDWSTLYRDCNYCNTTFTPVSKERYCTDKCLANKRYSESVFHDRENEFVNLYNQFGSINRALKEMGFPGTVSSYYNWANSMIKKFNLSTIRMNGNNDLVGTITCRDKNGIVTQVSQNEYHSQTGNKENWEFVSVASKEGKLRKNS